MRQAKKRERKYNRTKPYLNPLEFKPYKKRDLEEKELMPFIIWMYNSLDKRNLRTKLIDAPKKRHSNHKIRENEDTNPLWYSHLCALYPKKRTGRRASTKSRRNIKFIDTKIYAIHIQKALKNIIIKGYSHSLYFEDYVRIAKELKKQYTEALELREEESKGVILREHKWAYDLLEISMELSPDEDFSIAEGFPNSYNIKGLEKRVTEEDLPF